MIGIRNGKGELDVRIVNDPRLSSSQIDALRKVAALDTEARIEGLDQKMRPVVNTTLGGERTRYALLRNGDPAKPAVLYENWNPGIH